MQIFYADGFGVLFEFLGPAKYNLNYWNSTARKKGKSSKPSSNKLFNRKKTAICDVNATSVWF